ncbi:MAG TPA: DUF4091 domain-containing protein, partial [Opitutales bacterium]|nr:DUF4091 domain-containing protein [Opitutales bacterium]
GPDDKTFTLNAWRGERVHAQGVVWSKENQGALALASGDFTGASGAKIPASAVTGRFLRTVETRVRSEKRSLWRIGDCLDPKASAWPKEGYRVFWFTVDVPADAAPGGYSCTFTVKGKGGPLDFPVQLIVSPKTLPAPKDRKFFLDVWQHPWSVAEHAGVKPFSPEHYTLLEPFYRELAAAGQRVIGTTILDLPWGEGYGEGRGEIRDMVKTFRRADGGFRYDFTTFDEFVAFAKRCGVGPQIHCYTIVKFNNKRRFYFTDEKTGKADSVELMEGTPEYEAFLTPLLTALRDHLKEKGWLQDAYIAIDEARPERLVAPRKFLKRVAPELKFALASNIDPLLYKELDADTDVFSQILWTGHGITTLFTPAFDAFMAARRKAGKVTTFYVCTQPQKPNTWFESPLAETAWLGLYAAAKGWDGFLRWATFYWPKDPFGAPCQKGYPAGEDFFLYPGSLASARWEILRDAIENWEKIRVLRESGQAAPQLEKALKALDYLAVNEDPPESTRAKVKAVLDQLR